MSFAIGFFAGIGVATTVVATLVFLTVRRIVR